MKKENLKKLRRLMYAANYLNKHQTVLLRGAKLDRRQSKGFALHMAWYFEDFRKMLSKGIWQFSYFKKEGGIRQALGTLDFDLIPQEHWPKGDESQQPTANSQQPSPGTFSYFDLDKNAWRSFCLDLFIGFVEPMD